MQQKPVVPSLKTRNLKHAAFLHSIADVKLVGVEKLGRDALFCFAPEDRAKEVMDQYFTNTLRVDPRLLFESWENLKDMIFYRQAEERKEEEPSSVETVQPRVTGGRGGNREY